MGQGTLTRPPIGLWIGYMFGRRLPAEYRDWAERDIRSGAVERRISLLTTVMLVGAQVPNLVRGDSFGFILLGVILVAVTIAFRLRRRADPKSATGRHRELLIRYHRGEMTRREYADARTPWLGWPIVALALSIPVVTLVVWLLTR